MYTKKVHLDRESFPKSLNLPGWTSLLVFQQSSDPPHRVTVRSKEGLSKNDEHTNAILPSSSQFLE